MWNTEKMLVHPDFMLCPWRGQIWLKKTKFLTVSVHVNVATCIWTMLATHLTTMSLTVPHLLFFIICSKGLIEKIGQYICANQLNLNFNDDLRKSFWKWKFDNSPFWMNFWASCLRKGEFYSLHICICIYACYIFAPTQPHSIPQWIYSEEGDILNCVHPNQVKVLTKNLESCSIWWSMYKKDDKCPPAIS